MKQVIGIVLLISLVNSNSAKEIEAGLDVTICKEDQSLGCAKLGEYACGFENIIEGKVEDLRQLLKAGNSEKGIPSFDPFVIESDELTLDNPTISGNLNISNLQLVGIPEFVKTIGCLNGLRPMILELGLRFDKIVLTTGYSGILNLLEMLNIFGTGDASIKLNDLNINIVAEVQLPMKIKKIEAALVLPTVDIKLTGLFNDEYMSDIISRQLSDTLTTLAKEEEARINAILNEFLKKLLEQKPEEIFKQVEEQSEPNLADVDIHDIVEALKHKLYAVFRNKDFLINWLTTKVL